MTASRALGYAQVIADLDGGGDGYGRARADVRRNPPLCAPAAVLVPPRPPDHLAGRCGRRQCRRHAAAYGGTYPDQVKFAKGHGTQNDFVLLPDLDGRAAADARRGGRAVRPPPGTRRRRRAARDHRRARRWQRGSSTGCPKAWRPTTGTWTTATPTARSRRCAATACGCSPTTCAPAAWNAATSSSSARWPARGRSCCTAWTPPTPTSPSRWARPTSSAPARRSSAAGRSPGLAVDVGNPHLACVDPDLTVDGLAALDVAAPVHVRPRAVPGRRQRRGADRAVDGAVSMRVHERGVGETRSCGTGTVAAAVAALAYHGATTGTLTVRVPGGEVDVTVTDASSYLRGPSVLVARGEISRGMVACAAALIRMRERRSRRAQSVIAYDISRISRSADIPERR